jgi:cation:H+ antiporter
MLIFWIIIFVISLVFLVKSSDWLLESAEKIGFSLGMSPFLIGITIVGIGTSLPELVSSLFAVFGNVTEIVVANAVGSNIANIFLIIGISVLVAKNLTVTKNLIDLDIPLIVLSTALFYMTAYDGKVTFIEGVLLIGAYTSYILFSIFVKESHVVSNDLNHIEKVKRSDYVWLGAGIIVLSVSANYLIESVIAISDMLKIAPAIISITAVAIGTSLPELLVSIKAARAGKSEVALGNIFGSNVFNLLGVVGISSLFSNLSIDTKTLSLGIPVLIIATILFAISGISKKIHMQEGVFYLIIYVAFMGKLFEIF